MAEQGDDQPANGNDTAPKASHEAATPAESATPPVRERPAEELARPSEADDTPTPEPGDADEPKPRPKREPVRSLAELYTVKGANANKLLRELEKETSWKFADEDVEAALALLTERDPHLARTRQLLHEAIETREGRFARAASDFAMQALASDINGLQGWPPREDTDSIAALQELTQRLAPDLRHPKHQRRTHNVLMIAVDLLSYWRGLAFEMAAPVLREAIGRPPEYERNRSNPRRHRVASVTLPRNDLERVRDLLDLLQPWERELEDAEKAGRQASTEAREASRAADVARARERQLAAEVTDLRAQLETARQEAESSRDQVQDVRIHASADVNEVRTRAIAFLNTRLRDLLATAKEASEVDPPRTGTALRLLEQAIQELRKEVEWLRSSA